MRWAFGKAARASCIQRLLIGILYFFRQHMKAELTDVRVQPAPNSAAHNFVHRDAGLGSLRLEERGLLVRKVNNDIDRHASIPFLYVLIGVRALASKGWLVCSACYTS